jgi:hypothetical protein
MKKRSKYRPRPVLINPLGYVLESMKPVAHHDQYLIDLKIKNNQAMVALLRGEAVYSDIDTLIAMSNIVEALYKLGFGDEYKDVTVDGREAIISIVHRATDIKRFTPTGLEIQALNLLMELHDAQMDVITIKDMERALDYIKLKMSQHKATRLPRMNQA